MWIISALLDDKKQRNRQNMAEIDKCRGVSVVNNLITRQHIVDLCKSHCYYVQISIKFAPRQKIFRK